MREERKEKEKKVIALERHTMEENQTRTIGIHVNDEQEKRKAKREKQEEVNCASGTPMCHVFKSS